MDCARKYGRYGHRDATMILVAYRHGLRASEVCDLQWQQIELSEGRLHVDRVKNGIPSVHPIRGDEMRALRKLRREYAKEAYVFVSERGTDDDGGPKSPCGLPDRSLTTYSSPHGAAPPTRHTVRSRPRRRWHLARHALARADCRVGLQHQPVLGLGSGRRGGCWFYRPLDHFGRASSLRCKRGLDVLDHGFKLLVRQVFERIAVLDLVLAGDKQGETSQVHPRLLAAHLCDGFFSVLTEIA